MAAVLCVGNLVNSFSHRHGIDCEGLTYARGKKRVDYILMSHDLVAHLESCGIEPFNHRIFSDHSGLFLDITTTNLFDREITALAHPSGRHINTDCPKHVAMYIASLHQYLQAHHVIKRIDDLLTLTPNDPAAEAINRDVTRAMLHAKLQCKSFRRLPWTKDVHQATTVLHILKRQLTQLLTYRSMQRQIDHRQKQLAWPTPLLNSVLETKKALHQARAKCRQVTQESRSKRQLHLAKIILAKQLAHPNSDPFKIENQYRRAQATKSMFLKVPSCKTRQSSGISMLHVPTNPHVNPKTTTNRTTLHDPIQVEAQLLDRNHTHFSQARHTPLALSTVTDALLIGGISSISDQLLKGTYDLELISQYAPA